MFTKLQVESICVEMSALLVKVMCPCLKELRFVVVEVATSFQDVHAMFFKQTELQSAHVNNEAT